MAKKKSSEVLSQDEIDQLLGAISGGSSAPDDEKFKSIKDERKIKIYDFKRPDRFSREQIRQMSDVFEDVCRVLTTYFSAKMRSLVHFHVASADQLTFEEFVRSIPTPTCLCSTDWHGEKAVIEIDPAITNEFLFAQYVEKLDYVTPLLCDEISDLPEAQQNEICDIIRCAFKSKIIHDFTDSELLFMKEFVFRPLYREIRKSFNEMHRKQQNVLYMPGFMSAPGKPENDAQIKNKKNPLGKAKKLHLETNPQFMQVVSPGEMVMLITIECKIGDEEGMMNVCLPYPFVRGVLIKRGIIMSNAKKENDFSLNVEPGNSQVSLGQFNMPEGAKLEEGTIIELDKLAGEPVDLMDKKTGRVFARGEVVVIDESFGVRVTEVL